MRDFVVDESDQATEVEMRDTQLAIEHARRSVVIPFTGKCYNCDEQLETPYRWCNGDCRDDWEKRVKTQ